MLGGILAAMILPVVLPDHISALEAFPLNLLISLIGCFLGSLLTPPNDDETLKKFYLKTRPWGFWKPVYKKLKQEHPQLEQNKNVWRDSFNVIIGIIWQTSLAAAPIFLIIQYFTAFAISMGIAIICSVILKYNWYDHIEDYPADLKAEAVS